MKKSRILILAIMLLFVIPSFVKAEVKSTNNPRGFSGILLEQSKKYLKTVNVYDNVVEDEYGNFVSADLISSTTYELTKEEWDNINLNDNRLTRSTTTIETTYKLMTTSLYYTNGSYRYENQLNWLNFPSVRAYDIIAIGHYNNITPNGTPTFSVDYTTASGVHYVSTLGVQQTFSSGTSVTFPLPLQNLQSLGIMLYFNAKKVNTGNTIYSQAAYGDYAHGINTSLTYNEATDHSVIGSLGIVHDSSVFNKFDTINEAAVYWSGTW